MKITTLQINLIILCLVLVALQAGILWLMNGDLKYLVNNKELDVLALIFAPSAGIVWCAKKMAVYTPGRCHKCGGDTE